MTVSTPDSPVVGCLSTGIPLPSSFTCTRPSSEMETSMSVQKPAMNSSTLLSTISNIR